MASRTYWVYIMTNRSRTLYTGVTSDLARRVYEHRNRLIPGFTSRYRIDRLVHAEQFYEVREAIAREKQIKSWVRARKIDLISESAQSGTISVKNGSVRSQVEIADSPLDANVQSMARCCPGTNERQSGSVALTLGKHLGLQSPMFQATEILRFGSG